MKHKSTNQRIFHYTDELVDKEDIMKLRKLAERLTEEVGYQSYSNRESINLKWINLHKLFRMQKEKKNILKQKEYELIKKASEAAKVSSWSIKRPFFEFKF